MKNQKLTFILIFLFGIGLGGVFFIKGFKTPKGIVNTETAEHSHEAGNDKSVSVEFNKDSLDNAIDVAIDNLNTGLENNDPVLMMQKGIFVLRDALKVDPKNEKANYHMALLNLERGRSTGDKEQILKAKEKAELLLQLDASNEDYLKLIEDVSNAL